MPESHLPYKPSWVDHLLDWIDRLPMPNWLFYVLLYFVGLLDINAALWIDGVLPMGELDPLWVFNAIYVIISLGLLHLLERSSNRAVDKFAGLLPKKKKEIEIERYKMTNLPARPVLWMTIIFGALMTYLALTQPDFLPKGIDSPIATGMMLVMLVFAYSFVPILVYQGTRLLRSVTALYALVEDVNIFHQQPLYAFSGLAFQASLFWILFGNLSYVSLVLEASGSNINFVDYSFGIIMMLLAFATFLLPPWGIHKRLVEAKLKVQEETSVQIDETQRKLFAAIKKNDFKEIGGLDAAISSLYRVHEQLKSVPTWPWAPGGLRNFLSAVFLPMLLWLAQELASRYF